MFKHFKAESNFSQLDSKPFVVGHNLADHPSLKLENLSKVLSNLPQDRVMYSKGLNDLNINFDRAHIDKKGNLTLEETIEQMKTADSYIMVRSLETDPSFKDIYADLIKDVSKVMQAKGVGAAPIEPKLYLFIASPNAMTPFHIDRYSTFLFQIRGSKTVAVFDQFSDEVVSNEIRESFADYGLERPQWSEEIDHLGEKFQFTPGQALHIPFISGHYIKNGSEDVSISMSIIFRTDESQMWLDAMAVNNRLRKQMKLSVSPVGQSILKDRVKSKTLPLLNVVSKLKQTVRGA